MRLDPRSVKVDALQQYFRNVYSAAPAHHSFDQEGVFQNQI